MLIVLGLIFKWFFNKRIKRWIEKLANFSTISRLFIQTYFDLVIYAQVNLISAVWSSENPTAVTFSNILAIVVLTLCFLAPLLIICFHLKKGSAMWADRDFKKKHGTLLEQMQVFDFVPHGAD